VNESTKTWHLLTPAEQALFQGQGYDRRRLSFGPRRRGPIAWPVLSLYKRLRRATRWRWTLLEAPEAHGAAVDQTTGPEAVAQILCILRKQL